MLPRSPGPMMTTDHAHDAPLRHLVLESEHEALGARFVPFAGWRMPIQYTTGTLDEHRTVREAVGVFDVSHMGNFFVTGPDAVAAVDQLVTNDIASLPVGKAAYTVMCNDAGGIIDDLIVYKLSPARLMIIVNAGTCAGDRAHFEANLHGDLTFEDRSDDFVLLAVQGPKAFGVVNALSSRDLSTTPTYGVAETTLRTPNAQPLADVIAARTGYTGEDGFELLIPNSAAPAAFKALFDQAQGILKPIGLAARDTLRLEAKYPLYSQDITLQTNPLEAGLGWVVKMAKASPFKGKQALEAIQATGLKRRLVGVVMRERGVLRPGYTLHSGGQQVGVLTSGSMSISLGYAVGLAYVDAQMVTAATQKPTQTGTEPPTITVDIRGKHLPVSLTQQPFYRRPR